MKNIWRWSDINVRAHGTAMKRLFCSHTYLILIKVRSVKVPLIVYSNDDRLYFEVKSWKILTLSLCAENALKSSDAFAFPYNHLFLRWIQNIISYIELVLNCEES
jgi:hypothetical protein